jgi:glyoxylase-like metal-dependent hydrolase (beta-lactamase superfamily II)
MMLWFLRALIISFLIVYFSQARADPATIPADLGSVTFVEVAPNIFVLHGLQQMRDGDNKGLISNSGIVITDSGVVLVDSGGSYEIGRTIVDQVRKLTDKPIIAVFNSHIHGDHWLGNAAIREAFPNAKIFAHKRTIERLRTGEAEEWNNIIRQLVGNDSAEPDLVLPDVALEGNEELALDGKMFATHHTGHAHTDGDIMIQVPDQRLLFTKDIVEYGRLVSSDVPQDFDVKGQIAAIEYMLALPIDIFVPGHGETGGQEIPMAALEFLKTLHDSVKKNYDAGLKDYEMRDKVADDLHEFQSWFNFDQLGKMIIFVYQQVELENFYYDRFGSKADLFGNSTQCPLSINHPPDFL